MALGEKGRLTLLPLALAAAAAALSAAPAPEIRFVTRNGDSAVELRLDDPELLRAISERAAAAGGWSPIFAVYTAEASAAGGRLPPLLGEYRLEEWGVSFTPRFEPAAGQTYVARFVDPFSGEELRATYAVPVVDAPPSTELTGIHPSVSEVPENLLRIYLQFSAPMSRGNARHHIRLLDEAGRVVTGPFVAPERELWSPDGTRLTLFFDPGRIKRGVGPNAEVGPPLRAGRGYRLVVDRDFIDGRGLPLVRDYSKELRVGEADRDQPRTDDWRLEPPAGPREPVRLAFPEPLDRGLLIGLLTVLDEAGAPVPGNVVVAPGETVWSFEPESVWGGGVYRIRVGTLLEDLAGNSLRRPFEAALGGSGREGAPYVDLPFSRR